MDEFFSKDGVIPEGYLVSCQPNQKLNDFVESFWILNLKDAARHEKPELEQPSLYPEIMFKFGQDFEVFYPKNMQSKIHRTGSITGIRSFAKASKRTNFNHKLFVVGVKLKPLGMFTLFNTPLNEFYNQTLSFKDLPHPFLEELENELAQIVHPSAVIDYLNVRLLFFFTQSPISFDAIRFYKEIMDTSLIHKSIKDSNFNYKYLERKFNKYIGVTPKKYYKLQRYLSFYDSWFEKNKFKYIDMVYENNYFDQSHLIKDFKSVLGLSPNQFLKSMDENYTQNIKKANLQF